jgi:hypothetical protein
MLPWGRYRWQNIPPLSSTPLFQAFDKEKRGWDGKQEKQFLTAMAWKRGVLDRGGIFCHL